MTDRFDDDSRDWLATRAFTPDALSETYNLPHALVGGWDVTASCRGNDLAWTVELRTRSGAPVLEGVLARRAIPEGNLRGEGDATGFVAEITTCRLLAENRGQGLGTMIHEHEVDLFRRWQIDEVQLHAVEGGAAFWAKNGFLPADPGVLAELYDEWAEREGFRDPPPTTLLEYRPEFLATQFVPMYKKIEP